jgi:hypothetical protein
MVADLFELPESRAQNSAVRTWPVPLQPQEMLPEELIAEPCNRYGSSYSCAALSGRSLGGKPGGDGGRCEPSAGNEAEDGPKVQGSERTQEVQPWQG